MVAPELIGLCIQIIVILFKSVVLVGVVMLHVAYATYFERKVIGHMQVRLGPMRVGYHGLLQPVADMMKLLFKEDIIPSRADKPIFFSAPVISFVAVMTALSVIPFSDDFSIANINVGLLFILAMSSISAYGIIFAGIASDSKFAFLGSLRSAAQVLSYEVALGLSLVGVMMLAGSLNLRDIVYAQSAYPFGMFIFPQMLGFFVFLTAAFAETNRTPFDLPEAESELVAGYFTEYSGFRFALFYAAEYVAMIVMSSLGTICYLGGWTLPPFLTGMFPFLLKIPGVVWFALKIYGCIFIFYWIRATVPRYRYDQLMNIGWKILIPLSLLNILITGLLKMIGIL
ncbi:MAG: NADH-quinone oxidoreductase subunit NuoH [Dissulfurispiraceae bacterium]